MNPEGIIYPIILFHSFLNSSFILSHNIRLSVPLGGKAALSSTQLSRSITKSLTCIWLSAFPLLFITFQCCPFIENGYCSFIMSKFVCISPYFEVPLLSLGNDVLSHIFGRKWSKSASTGQIFGWNLNVNNLLIFTSMVWKVAKSNNRIRNHWCF